VHVPASIIKHEDEHTGFFSVKRVFFFFLTNVSYLDAGVMLFIQHGTKLSNLSKRIERNGEVTLT
jgi:hypothetical protein